MELQHYDVIYRLKHEEIVKGPNGPEQVTIWSLPLSWPCTAFSPRQAWYKFWSHLTSGYTNRYAVAVLPAGRFGNTL